MSADLATLLDGLTRMRGVRGALLVSAEDGITVAGALLEEEQGPALAALAATLLARVRELIAETGHEPPRFLHLQSAEGLLLLAPAAGDLVVVSVAGREALIGPLRLEMLRIAEQLD
ncbi:MAG: roadblock/LC7 domain-containing protein [Gemmatimonadota bacterium]|nr:roadblock/LC7 domain-containing protein [Gemmatimonadota bacterium]MDH4348787.1 roadblock/LC7 domain-containing protein [Gemmatimonadota bacterium]MDH5284772.1 roadblock/LC7 domain-containing protein [Gemmatimonadota bacterium]